VSSRRQISLVAVFLFAVPILAKAQNMSRMSFPVAQAPRVNAPSRVVQPHRSSVAATPIRVAKSHESGASARTSALPRHSDVGIFTFNKGFNVGAPVSIQDLLNPYPGLGFDFQNLAMMNQDFGIKAVIDPATQWRLAIAERLQRSAPFYPGFFLLGGGGYYDMTSAEEPDQGPQPPAQPQVIVLQQQPQAEQQAPQPSQEEANQAPLPDEGEFTFVLHDGTRIQAAAFTRANGEVVYITPEGGRRTLKISDIDSEATSRVNQENGTPLQLPL